MYSDIQLMGFSKKEEEILIKVALQLGVKPLDVANSIYPYNKYAKPVNREELKLLITNNIKK